MKPTSPCRIDCPDRSEVCHSELCPHGWAEYERQRNEYYLQKQAEAKAKAWTEGHVRGVRKKQKQRKKKGK